MLNKVVETEVFRIANFVPVLLGIGIAVYFQLASKISVPCVQITLLIFTILPCLLKRTRWLAIGVGLIFLGFSVALLRTHLLSTNMLQQKVKYAKIEGVIDTVESTANGIKFVVSDIKCDKAKLDKVSLTWRTKISPYGYSPGDRALFTAILDPIYPPTFKHAYDFRKQAFFNGISARGYITKEPSVISKSRFATFTVFKNTIRQKIDQAIDSKLAGQHAALIKTLITGNKSALSHETREAFSDAGIAHILAISGLHIGIIVGVFFIFFRLLFCTFFRKLSLLFDVKKISIILALFFAFIYLQISGESVPAVRSFIMYGLIAIAVLLSRTALSMRSVSIAATIILLAKPEAMLFPSFQMSFSAVIALVAFYEKSWTKSTRFIAIASLFFTSIIASTATSVFAINTFNRLSLGGVFSNLIAVPMMSFLIMPMIVVAVLLLPVVNIFGVMKVFTGLLMKLANYVSSLQYASITLPTPDSLPFILVICGGLWLAMLVSQVRWLGFIPIVAGILVYARSERALIYVSAFDKVVGIKCGDYMCFNDMSSLRRISEDFMKSEGITEKHNFKHKRCRDCLKKVEDGVFSAHGYHIIVPELLTAPLREYRNSIVLNDKHRKTAKIYYANGRTEEYKIPHRPWTKCK